MKKTTLEDYLKKTGLTIRVFAGRLDISERFLYLLVRVDKKTGKFYRPIPLSLAIRIDAETGGIVPYKQYFPEIHKLMKQIQKNR